MTRKLTTGDIILMETLRVLSKPDFDTSGISNTARTRKLAAGDVARMATLRVLSKPDFDTSGIPNLEDLMDKLQAHREKLGLPWPLEEDWLERRR